MRDDHGIQPPVPFLPFLFCYAPLLSLLSPAIHFTLVRLQGLERCYLITYFATYVHRMCDSILIW